MSEKLQTFWFAMTNQNCVIDHWALKISERYHSYPHTEVRKAPNVMSRIENQHCVINQWALKDSGRYHSYPTTEVRKVSIRVIHNEKATLCNQLLRSEKLRAPSFVSNYWSLKTSKCYDSLRKHSTLKSTTELWKVPNAIIRTQTLSFEKCQMLWLALKIQHFVINHWALQSSERYHSYSRTAFRKAPDAMIRNVNSTLCN